MVARIPLQYMRNILLSFKGYIKEGIIAVIIIVKPTALAKGIRAVARHP